MISAEILQIPKIGAFNLHGSLLPKNPHFADHLLGIALARKYGASEAVRLLAPLDDAAEWQAHEAMLRRLGVPTGTHQ